MTEGVELGGRTKLFQRGKPRFSVDIQQEGPVFSC